MVPDAFAAALSSVTRRVPLLGLAACPYLALTFAAGGRITRRQQVPLSSTVPALSAPHVAYGTGFRRGAWGWQIGPHARQRMPSWGLSDP